MHNCLVLMHELEPIVDVGVWVLYVRIASPVGVVHEPNGHTGECESDDTNYGTEYSEYYGLGIVVWGAGTDRWRNGRRLRGRSGTERGELWHCWFSGEVLKKLNAK